MLEVTQGLSGRPCSTHNVQWGRVDLSLILPHVGIEIDNIFIWSVMCFILYLDLPLQLSVFCIYYQYEGSCATYWIPSNNLTLFLKSIWSYFLSLIYQCKFSLLHIWLHICENRIILSHSHHHHHGHSVAFTKQSKALCVLNDKINGAKALGQCLFSSLGLKVLRHGLKASLLPGFSA